MIMVEFEEVNKTDENDNVVRRRVEEYPLVIETNNKYIAVEKDANYRIFEPGVVKSVHNDTGYVHDGSGEHDIPILDSFDNGYVTVHGDPNKINKH